MQMRKLYLATVVGGAFAACVATTSDAASVPTSQTPTAAQTASLTSGEINLLSSGTPIDVVMNPTNGDILSVTPAR